jgi:hypothetical protein
MSSTRRTRRILPAFVLVASALSLGASALAAQHVAPQAADSLRPPRFGSELLIPLSSAVLPGLGQVIHGAPATGAAYAGLVVGGLALTTVGDAWGASWEDLPLTTRDQIADQGAHLLMTALFMSPWDAFHRAVPALQAEGKYQFLDRRESVRDLLTAPFDTRFLSRWTTWVDLAQTAAFTVLVLADRKGGTDYHAFRGSNLPYAASLSMNAAVGEEAFFRGYVMPLVHENSGGRFWVANGTQAALFGVGHMAEGGDLLGPAVTGAWALWAGWVTQRNDWSIRESIFHHFWYDVAIVTAAYFT